MFKQQNDRIRDQSSLSRGFKNFLETPDSSFFRHQSSMNPYFHGYFVSINYWPEVIISIPILSTVSSFKAIFPFKGGKYLQG